MPDPQRQGPIFIVGAMGSGTTLLRLILDAHENIAIPQETGFMRAYDAHLYAPFKASGRNWTKRLGWSPEERDELLGELYDRLFMRYAERHGKRRWGEKTPLHTWHVDDIARVFPDARFVGVIRHPSASVASNMRRFRLLLGRTATHWARYTGEIVRQAGRHGDRFALIRYEDLVLHPEPLLRELLEWLEEPWSESVLAHHAVHGERGGRMRTEGRGRRDEPIDVTRVGKWKETLPEGQQRWIADRLARRAEFFGYAIDEPAPVAPLAEGGGLVVRGEEVERRIEQFPDLDLRTRPQVPIYEREYDPREVMLITREQFALLTRPRGVRGAGAALARRLPDRPRQAAVKAVRGTRAALGLRRRPKKAG
ncbi:MAG TPA: sulfotransferase [Solirubrobacteraceae bacterium]|nr:sulfotransferase [Solirubrobacteraceae bacterium]